MSSSHCLYTKSAHFLPVQDLLGLELSEDTGVAVTTARVLGSQLDGLIQSRIARHTLALLYLWAVL